MILIIDDSIKKALTVADVFHLFGVPTFAVAPEKAAAEISNLYRAVLFTSPEKIGDLTAFADSIKRYSLGAPFFAILPDGKKGDEIRAKGVFNRTFTQSDSVSEIFIGMLNYVKENELETPGIYRLAGLDASIGSDEVTYFGEPIEFTKTETMIIRVLIRMGAAAAKPDKIVKYAFRQGRLPEKSNVRTHISFINKKFFAKFESQLIETKDRAGYVIATPGRKKKELALK